MNPDNFHKQKMSSAELLAEYLIEIGNRSPEEDPPTLNRITLLMYFVNMWNIALRDKAIFLDPVLIVGNKPMIEAVQTKYGHYGVSSIERVFNAELLDSLSVKFPEGEWEVIYKCNEWMRKYSTYTLFSWAFQPGTPLGNSIITRQRVMMKDVRAYVSVTENLKDVPWFDQRLLKKVEDLNNGT